jgi:hypothetical protein
MGFPQYLRTWSVPCPHGLLGFHGKYVNVCPHTVRVAGHQHTSRLKFHTLGQIINYCNNIGILFLVLHYAVCASKGGRYVYCRFAQPTGVCEPTEWAVSVVLTLTILSSSVMPFLSIPRQMQEYHPDCKNIIPVCFNSSSCIHRTVCSKLNRK